MVKTNAVGFAVETGDVCMYAGASANGQNGI